MEKILSIVGLILNVVGTIILALPFLWIRRDLEDDLLVDGKKEIISGKEKIWYTRKGFLKERKITLIGLGLLFFGFLLQLIIVIVPLKNFTTSTNSKKLHLEDYVNLSRIEFKWIGDKLYWSGDVSNTYDKSISFISVKVDFYKEMATGSPFDTKYLTISNIPANKKSHFRALVFGYETLKTRSARLSSKIYEANDQKVELINNPYMNDLSEQ